MTTHQMEHTEEELRTMIEEMRKVSAEFYSKATRIGNHAFIEFCGLMNEYIKMCETSLANGVDFAMSNTHSEQALVVLPYHMNYLGEKFDCIFGPTLRKNKEMMEEFMAPFANE